MAASGEVAWYQEATINGVAMPVVPHKDSARHRWERFIKPLLGTDRGLAFDLGCNAGFYCRELKDLGYSVMGMDWDVAHAVFWEKHHPKGIEYIQGDINSWNMPYGTLALAACVLYWQDEYAVESLVERLRHRVAHVIVMSRNRSSSSHKSDGTLQHMKTVFRLWDAGQVIKGGRHYSVAFHNRKIRQASTDVLDSMSVRSMTFNRGVLELADLVLKGEPFDPKDTIYYKYLHERAVGGRFQQYVELIGSVRQHGIMVPVKVCNGNVIDGANRIVLAKRFGIPSLLYEDVSVG